MTDLPSSTQIHASCVAIATSAGREAVLIRGPSGSGKSDLSYRLIREEDALLVADDYVILRERDGDLFSAPPEPLKGLLELRGLGLVRLPFVAEVPVSLIVDLVDSPDLPPRIAEPSYERIENVAVPRLLLWPFAQTAPAKIIRGLQTLSTHGFPKDDGIFG